MTKARIKLAILVSVFIITVIHLPNSDYNREGTLVKPLQSYQLLASRHADTAKSKVAAKNVTLVIVRTRPDQRARRDHIRQVIRSRPQCSLKQLFLFGKLDDSAEEVWSQELLAESINNNGDILRIASESDDQLNYLFAVEVIKARLHLDSISKYDQIVFADYALSWTKGMKLKDIRKDLLIYEKTEKQQCMRFAIHPHQDVTITSAYFPAAHNAEASLHLVHPAQGDFRGAGSVAISYNYDLLIGDQRMCSLVAGQKQLFAVIAVHSTPNNYMNRRKIRETWGVQERQLKYNVKLLFFVGVNHSSWDATQRLLREESAQHQDIVQFDFEDSYKNMTLKQMCVFQFLTKLCSHLPYLYILKADDDVVIDLHVVQQYFLERVPTHVKRFKRTILCTHVNGPTQVPREGKWGVSYDDYPADLYPPYCSGAGYFVPKKLASLLYEKALQMKSFWVDDTFISGIAAKALQDVTLLQLPKQQLIPTFYFHWYHTGRMGKMFIHVGQDMEKFDAAWLAMLSMHDI